MCEYCGLGGRDTAYHRSSSCPPEFSSYPEKYQGRNEPRVGIGSGEPLGAYRRRDSRVREVRRLMTAGKEVIRCLLINLWLVR